MESMQGFKDQIKFSDKLFRITAKYRIFAYINRYV
jgi:hypothetical protein